MIKKTIFVIGISLSVFLFFWYLSKSQYDKKQKLKLYPKKYAYYVHEYDSSVSRALGSEEMDCVLKIRNYYKTLDQGSNVAIPTCAIYDVGLQEQVHVMEEDSVFIKVAYFYRARNGKEKHFIGYMWRNTIHETPYAVKK